MRFLVIPEDHRNDQYMLEPILSELVRSAGFANPKVRVCRDPLMGGVSEALKPERLEEVFARYKGMIDVFLLCVDRDADLNRQARLDILEARFGPRLIFIPSQAWEEIETWMLAGLDLPASWRWQEVRGARDVKEAYFEPLAGDQGLSAEPGGGRRTLGRLAARRVGRIRQRCPEDFDLLGRRIEALRTSA